MKNTQNEGFSLIHNLANKRLNYAFIQKSYWKYKGMNQKDFERLYRGRVSKRGIIPKGNRNKNLSNLREWSTHKDSHNTISIKLPPNPKLLHKSTILINTTLFHTLFVSFLKDFPFSIFFFSFSFSFLFSLIEINQISTQSFFSPTWIQPHHHVNTPYFLRQGKNSYNNTMLRVQENKKQ